MKIEELVENKNQGTYAGAHFSDQTIKDVGQYLKDNNIPNAVDPKSLHVTILYSRKYLPNYKPAGQYDQPMVATPKEFEVWKDKFTDQTRTKKANVLVLKFECPELSKRHKDLMDEHKGTWDYDDYRTHLTLSYNVGDLDPSELPKYKGEIKIVSEYGEDLDLSYGS